MKVDSQPEVVQILLDFNADIGLEDNRPQTALDWAQELKHPGIETLLLQAHERASEPKRPSIRSLSPQLRYGEQADFKKDVADSLSECPAFSLLVVCCLEVTLFG